MKKIICNFSLFDMEQTIYIYIEEDGVQRYEPIGKCGKIENLGHMLVEVRYANDIYNKRLFGHSRFIDGVLNDIDAYSNSAYSIGLITVEVN
jgi:hypothetical protein